MRKFILPLLLVASISAPSLAMAAATPNTDIGTIKALNAKALTLTLSDGYKFKLTKKISLADLKVGEKVKITWVKLHGMREIEAIHAE